MENIELRGVFFASGKGVVEGSKLGSWRECSALCGKQSVLDTALFPLLKLRHIGGSCPPGGIKPDTFDSWDNPCMSATTVLLHSCFSIASRRLQVDIAGSPAPKQAED